MRFQGSRSTIAVHGMIGDAHQDLSQIRFGIQSVEFRRVDQAVDPSSPLSPDIGSGKQIIPLCQKCARIGCFHATGVSFERKADSPNY